ncbi:transcription repressor OFP6-like [Impatiens glandulifera]|uniref:transcription repressor OFP6-like n=1 Tax=Impatiens glandulifera TaxID=253017 RepID=UPI001FB08950|nr:transcription repressor OFP6-like [Impatiens glandulifera]
MSSIHSRKKVIKLNTVAVDLGCSCRRSRLLSAIFRRRPKKQPTTSHDYNNYNHNNYYYSDYTTPTTATTNSTFTPTGPSYFSDENYEEDEYSTDIKSLKAVQGFGRVGGESVAVEKDSDDPYLDFRRSMMRMIVEKEIYSKDDLRELLNCFLQLNSPYHHGIIIRAFSEIWNGVYYSGGRNGMGPM